MTTPPKEIWVTGPHVSASQSMGSYRYILAKEHREPKREVVAYVLKDKFGGEYMYGERENGTRVWGMSLSLAHRWPPNAPPSSPGAAARVVALVRKRGAT